MNESSSDRNAVEAAVRAPLAGAVLNGILAAIKITAGWLGNSYALVADGIESTTDILSSFIVWSGLHISLRPADELHPYGYGKAEALAGITGSLALLAAGRFPHSFLCGLADHHHGRGNRHGAREERLFYEQRGLRIQLGADWPPLSDASSRPWPIFVGRVLPLQKIKGSDQPILLLE